MLLDLDGSDEQAAQVIASDLRLVAEVRQVLPVLSERAHRKAGADGVKAVIGGRFGTFPQPERSPGEWAAWWSDYIDVLADMPLAALEAGMRAYLRDPKAEFMPKPGKLLDLARTTPSKTVQAYSRARRVLQITSLERQHTPADPAQVKAIMEDFTAKIVKPAEAVRPPPPATHGKTDETGITPALRQVMEARGAA